MQATFLFAALGLFNLAMANPVAAPHPPQRAEEDADTSACTTTLTSFEYGFRGTFTPTITLTVYTSTETLYSPVPCNGCVLAVTTQRSPFYGGVGPAERIATVVTATTPSTVISPICSPTPSDD